MEVFDRREPQRNGSMNAVVSIVFAIGIVLTNWRLVSAIDWPCTTEFGVQFLGHKTDCRSYFICEDGVAMKLYCPSKFVYHKESMSCVPDNGEFNPSCKFGINRPVAYAHPHCFEGYEEKVADPKSCARYYDCGANSRGPFDDDFLRECPYPSLWHAQLGRCVPVLLKDCGNRKEPYDPCEYLINQCHSSRCISCHARFPSCKGLPNGWNAWPGKVGTSSYIFCMNNRFVFKRQCTERNRRPRIFDPASKRCVFPGNKLSKT